MTSDDTNQAVKPGEKTSFFNDKGIAARTRIDDKVNALGAVVNIDEVRWLRLDQIRLKK